MSHPYVLSLRIGLPRDYGQEGAADPMDRPWRTAIFKGPVTGPVRLGPTRLEGDWSQEEAHQRVDQAVLAYAAGHYPYWQAEVDPAMGPGSFGENLTIVGQDEETVCLGDSYRIGTAVLQVSTPRGPCWKLARRWRRPDLTDLVRRNGKVGWYLRVLQPGDLQAGQAVELLERPYPDWPIARVFAARYHHPDDVEAAAALAANPLLLAQWRDKFRDRLPMES